MPTIYVLSKKDPLSWGLMPEVTARIMRMADAHRSPQYAGNLIRAMERAFIEDSPLVRTWLALEEFHVVGHLVSSIEKDCEGIFALVWQAETDHPIPDISRRVHEELEAWATMNKATRLVAHMQHGMKAVYERYGFTQSYFTVTKHL